VYGHNLDMYNVKAGLQRVTKQLNWAESFGRS